MNFIVGMLLGSTLVNVLNLIVIRFMLNEIIDILNKRK